MGSSKNSYVFMRVYIEVYIRIYIRAYILEFILEFILVYNIVYIIRVYFIVNKLCYWAIVLLSLNFKNIILLPGGWEWLVMPLVAMVVPLLVLPFLPVLVTCRSG